MNRFVTSLVVIAALLLSPLSVAGAQAVVLLPPRGDEQLATAQAEAHRVLANSLSSQGLRVVPHAEAQAALPDGPPCETSDCAPGLIAAAKAEFAAVVAVWAGADGSPGLVFVTLVDPEGARFPGQSKVSGQDLQAAASAALLDARGLQLLGPGPWLRVSGEPDGARVFIDGQYVGAVPYRATIASGSHRIEVRAEGHVSLDRAVDVPANRSRQIEIDVALEVLGVDGAGNGSDDIDIQAASDQSMVSAGPRDRSILGPALLGAAGFGLGLYAAIEMGSAGDCETTDRDGICLSERRSQGMGAVYLGVGIGAMAGALIWFLVSGGDESGSAGFRLDVGPRQLGASGSF